MLGWSKCFRIPSSKSKTSLAGLVWSFATVFTATLRSGLEINLARRTFPNCPRPNYRIGKLSSFKKKRDYL